MRVEHVIKAGSATRAFYCGACEHQWSIVEPAEPAAAPPPPVSKPRTRSYGPNRDE